MDKSITDNAVEQIAVNPDQTIQLVQNEDKFKNTAQYNQAVFDPSVVTPKTAKTLDDLSDWKEYLHDPWTATESGEFRFEKYKPVMDMSRDPVWYSLAQKYGRDMVMKTDTILGYYKPGGNALSRAIGAYNFASDSLRLADARRRLSDARAAGRELDVPDIENEIAELKYRLGNEEAPFQSENWNSLASVAASSVRNLPELVGIELLGGAAKAAAAAAIGSTGGLATPLAVGAISGAENVAQSAVIYGDTYNIEFGNVLHDIMSVRPDMPESEAREIARVGANISAAIEAAPSLLGGNIESVVAKRTGGAVLGKGGQRSVWSGIKAIAKRDPAAAKEVMKWLFKVAGEMGINMGTEGTQETLQDIVTGSAVKAATEGGDIAQLSKQQIVDLVTNPSSPESKALWRTFGQTMFGTGIWDTATRMLTGGVARGSRTLRNTLGRRKELPTIEQRAFGAAMNTELADRLYQMRQEGKTPDEVQKELWNRTIERGIAPENVYLDKQMAEALTKDPAVNEAIKQLGIQAALEESNNNGGLVEINFADYDEVVNKNDELYQKIRTAISFSPEALSMNQFQAYIDSLGAATREEIDRARTLSDSVYNQTLAKLATMGVTGPSAESQAYVSQFIANRVATMRLGQTATGEQAFSRLEIRMPDQPTTTSGLNQLITYNGEQKDLFNDVYTMGGKQVKYMGLDGKYTTGVNRAAITDDSSVKVVKMSPREFLSLTPYQMGSTDVSKLEDVVNNGGEIAMPFLTVEVEDPEKKTLRVIGHEGRHRSLALQNLGAARGYTVLESKDFYRQPELFKNGIAGWKILPQKGALYEDRSFDIEGDARGSVGETIIVDGKERPTRNNNGEPIADNELSLINFWRWFGDSKAVDAEGHPLVAYHNSGEMRDVLSREFARTASDVQGIFFSPKPDPYKEYGPYEHAVYLKIENPADFETTYNKHGIKLGETYDAGIKVREWLQQNGYDGSMLYEDGELYELIVFDSTQVKRTDNLGTWNPNDDRMLHQFVGEKAKTAAQDELAKAKELDAQGADNEEIRKQTGWFKGADGKWRFEISDKDAKINLDGVRAHFLKYGKEKMDQYKGRTDFYAKEERAGARKELAAGKDKNNTDLLDLVKEAGENTTFFFYLEEILIHDKLYEAYPWLKGWFVYIGPKQNTGEGGSAYSHSINLNTNADKNAFPDVTKTLLHEIQHVIQDEEKFAQGGMPETVRNQMNLGFNDWHFDDRMVEWDDGIGGNKFGFRGYKRILWGFGKYKEILYTTKAKEEDLDEFREYLAKNGFSEEDIQFILNAVAEQNEINSKKAAASKATADTPDFDLYQKLYGEIEARNTEARSGMTDEERRNTPVESTQDIKNADALVVFSNGLALNYRPVLHQFVGGTAKLAETAPELATRYKKAQQMMLQGKDDEEIFKETHLHVAPDGRIRVQISDKEAKVKPDIKRLLDWQPDKGKYTMTRKAKLGDIFSHPLLFELYPWLKDVEVKVAKRTKEYTETRKNMMGDIIEQTHHIEIANDEKDSRIRQSLLHEIQHAIQDEEGWAIGGTEGSSTYEPTQEERDARNERSKLLREIFEVLHDNKVITYWDASDSRVPTYRTLEPDESRSLGKVMADIAKDNPEFGKQVERLKELNKTLENYDEHDPRIRYNQLFGEAEARLTEKLSYMSQEELEALDPYQYFDTTQANIKYNKGSGRGFWVTLPENQQKVGEFDVELGFTEPITTGATGEGQVVAGTFFREGDKLVISLTPNANATTLVHELFHWFSYELQDAYNSGAMTDYWKKKVEAMARMVDAKFEVDPVDPNVKRLFLTPAQEEKAADMFLNFIKDGKIQNQEARPLFSYLQDEFRRIFKLANIQGYKMSPDAYELFNSIFSAQDVIEDEQRMVGMFQIVKPENADQGLYDFYTGEMASSQVRGTQELHKKWAGIEKYRKSEEYRNKFNEIRLGVAQELNQDTRYIVIDEANKHGGDAMATWNALMANPETSDLELSVDQVADIIANTPDKTTEIDRVANERMNEYIQQRFKITPEEMGLKASRNASKVKALLAEALMREGKVLADFDDEYRVLSQTADDQVAKTKLSRLSDKDYWDTLESNIVERYAYALVNKDERAMAQARRDQAIVNAIRMRADSITSRARRFQETADEFRGAQKKNSKTNEFKYAAKDYDLLQSLLESFGFPINYARRKPQPVAQKLDTWIDEQEATTMTRAGELRNFIPFIKEGFKGNFPAMTGAQFEKLEAVFNAVKSVAGAKYSILLANDKALLSELVASTNKNMEAMGIGPFRKKDGWWAKHFGVMSTFTNPEPIVRAIFPQDVLNKVWLPFIDAGVRAERFGREWVERYRIAKSKVDLTNKTKTYSNGRTLSNKQVADLLLAMGNQHAYENFLKSYDNMTEAEAEQVVSEALTDHPELADFAKDVWDIYGKATEQLDQEFEARTNTLFVEKDHRAFEINGIKFAGGYVPARKALDYVPTDQRAGNQGGMVHDKRFEKLITKKADGNIRSIVDITENELFQSAKQGYSAVEFNNARKFLLADGTKAAIGDRAFSFLSQWMETYIAPKYDTSGWIRPLQSLTSVSALGWRVSTAVLQLSGLGPAAAELGGTYWARGLAMAMKNGEWAPVMSTRKGANKSDYMFVRIADPRSSLLGNSIVDAVRATDAKTQFGKTAKFLMGKVGNAAMWGIQQVDTMVANVTWNGAYLRALDKGLSEVEARREADSVVRVAQSDSMQISRSQGMQDQLARVFTVFATWIMAMQSNLRAKIGTKQYSNAIVWAAMYMVLSPIFESFLKEATKPEALFGDDDDEDYVDRVMRACYNEVANTIGTSFIPAAGAGGTILEMLLSGLEEGLTGEKNIFEPRQSNVPILQTLYRGTNTLRYALSGNLEKAATYGASTVSTEAGRIVKYLLAE